MSAIAWLLVAIDAAMLAAIAVSRWRKAGRTYDAIAQGEPTADEIEALKSVLVAVNKASDRGATLGEFARAALVWMREQRYIR